MQTISRNAFKSSSQSIDLDMSTDLDVSIDTTLLWQIVCPHDRIWDGGVCTTQKPSQAAYVASFMLLCAFGALSTGFLIQRHKASYKSVARQM